MRNMVKKMEKNVWKAALAKEFQQRQVELDIENMEQWDEIENEYNKWWDTLASEYNDAEEEEEQ